MTTTDLPKQYDPQEAQRRYYELWLSRGYFHADPSSDREPYCIVIPPPNVTGSLHMCHAFEHSLIDATIRAIGRYGYASTTLTHVAGEAGLSPGIVNFYFKSKDQLLLATLEQIVD